MHRTVAVRWLPQTLIAFCCIVPAASLAAEKPEEGAEQASPLPPRALLRIGTDNLRTQSFITDLAFSPDGRLIAAVAANASCPTVVLFDVKTGNLAKRLAVPDATKSRTSSIAFSPDGARLLWGERDGHLVLWRLPDEQLVFRERLHAADVTDALYSHRGVVVATYS